jgi:hypothetical protein
MININRIFFIWQADFFDRIRRRNYLITLMCMAILTLLFLPDPSAGYSVVSVGGYRGLYNSAWIGASLAILNALFLPLICFYLVKNAVERDREQGISELIVPTPVKKFDYLLGKWLSNFTLLLGVMICMSLTSIFVQLFIGEDYSLNLVQLLLPQILYVLPILAVICAAAILFETIPLLRGGIGNVSYFFLWITLVLYTINGAAGVGDIIDQIRQAVQAYDPGNNGDVNVSFAVSDKARESRLFNTFVWSGINYNSMMIGAFAQLMGFALLLLVAATFIFDRFKKSTGHSLTQQASQKFAQKLALVLQPVSRLSDSLTNQWVFTRLVRQEFLLLIRGSSIWWYLAMIGLFVAQFMAPMGTLRAAVLPATWLMCVLLFSPMGQREIQHRADSLIFSCLSPLKKQFPAMLLAGFLLALLVVSGGFLRFILSGEFFSALMLLTGSLFISSLALACGSLTRTSRTFEVLFTALWYIGPLNKSALDFAGVDPQFSQKTNAPLMFLSASLVLIMLALLGRKLQLRY